jgi:hypothetical protein
VFLFSLTDNLVLKGNYGIGKTWAHTFINYLSINLWSYLVKYKSLEEIEKLVDLNLNVFKAIPNLE